MMHFWSLLDSPIILRVGAFVIFAVTWELYARSSDSLLVPTFVETAGAVVVQLRLPEVWQAFAISNVAMVIGFALSVAIGIPLGLLMGRFRLAESLAAPYLVIILATPLAGLIPLLTMSLGIGLASRVLVVWTFAVVMVVETCRAGVRQTDPSLLEMARVFGAGESKLWRYVLLPSALPSILSGVRIGLGRSVEGMVIVELIMVSVGIGGLILKYQAFFDGASLYAIVLLVVFESLILLWLVDAVQRRLTPWTSART